MFCQEIIKSETGTSPCRFLVFWSTAPATARDAVAENGCRWQRTAEGQPLGRAARGRGRGAHAS